VPRGENRLDHARVVEPACLGTGIRSPADPGIVDRMAKFAIGGMAQELEDDARIEREKPARLTLFTRPFGE
jgi:hypothetical protein